MPELTKATCGESTAKFKKALSRMSKAVVSKKPMAKKTATIKKGKA